MYSKWIMYINKHINLNENVPKGKFSSVKITPQINMLERLVFFSNLGLLALHYSSFT